MTDTSSISNEYEVSGFAAAVRAKRAQKEGKVDVKAEFDPLIEAEKATQLQADMLLLFAKKQILTAKKENRKHPAIIFPYEFNGTSLLQEHFSFPNRQGLQMIKLRADVIFYGHQTEKGMGSYRRNREPPKVKCVVDRVNEELTKYKFSEGGITYSVGIIDISVPVYKKDDFKNEELSESEFLGYLNDDRQKLWGSWWRKQRWSDGNGSKRPMFAIIPYDLNPEQEINLWMGSKEGARPRTRIVVPDNHPIGTIEPDFLTGNIRKVLDTCRDVPDLVSICSEVPSLLDVEDDS